MQSIKHISGWAVYDSRGRPTVAAEVILSDGSRGSAFAPSGASTGQKEAFELRDHGEKLGGYTVNQALAAVNDTYAKALIGQSFDSQESFDRNLLVCDGDPLKKNLGSNSALALSVAFARAAAQSSKQELYEYLSLGGLTWPLPWLNFINGGVHVSEGLSIQEFMIVPHGMRDLQDVIEAGAGIYMTLKTMLQAKGLSTLVGDEGGFAPALSGSLEALDLLMEAVIKTGMQPGRDVSLALDVAASECFKDSYYHIDGQRLDKYQWVERLAEWTQDYPIISLEDPADEHDWECWACLMHEVGQYVWLIGDDLFATQTEHINEGIMRSAANAVLIKPNQVGTLTEALEATQFAHENNMLTVMSHRSGDTEDSFIADCALAWGVHGIKSGACARSERLSKYNRLLTVAHHNPHIKPAQFPEFD